MRSVVRNIRHYIQQLRPGEAIFESKPRIEIGGGGHFYLLAISQEGLSDWLGTFGALVIGPVSLVEHCSRRFFVLFFFVSLAG